MKERTKLMSRRLETAYPWRVWAVGWLGLLKAFVWLAAEPPLPDNQLFVLGCKYALFMIPWLVFSLGAWQLKRWAAWGLLVLALGDILFFIFCPFALSSLALNELSPVTYVLSLAVFFVNGPASSVVILILLPGLFKTQALPE